MPVDRSATIIFLGTMLLAIAILAMPGAAEEYLEVESTELIPDPAVFGETIEVHVTLLDETNVSNVLFFYCSPMICYAPIEMAKDGEDYYSATGEIPIEEMGEHYYYISVKYVNTTIVSTEYIYFTPVEPFSTDLKVDNVTNVPVEVETDKEVEIFADLTNETGVAAVHVFHCKGDVCYAPVEMTQLQNGTYHTKIGPFDETEEIKYNITVTYDSGLKAWTQNYTFTPKEVGDDDDDDDGVIPAVSAVAVLAILAALAVTGKKKRRR
jgi:hypothetical protein